MILQNLTFGWVYKTFLGDNPTNAILFAGALLLLASLATLLIKVAKSTEEIDVSMSRGGH